MTTDGRRIYAIGDIHGCLAEMQAMHARIAADLAAAPHRAPLIVHVGDYVDRGPDSRGVIEALLNPALPDIETVSLLGNHDDLMLKFLDDPHGQWCRFHWLEDNLGGRATLASYGVTGHDPVRMAEEARAAVPAAHLDFLRARPRLHRVGSYVFVHAGIRPGVPLDEQDPEDLIWIRREFLDSRADHGAIVVHGHTPAREIELRPNRIGIDTGLVYGRHLTCLVLEDDRL
ncbi:MAG: serine/threonine protein phosphatase, partial [Alphaproteobacteria bacterium]